MRTTIDIPDSDYRLLKSKAALEGTSVRALILRSVRELTKPAEAKGKEVTLPLIKSKIPGRLRLTNKMINDLVLP